MHRSHSVAPCATQAVRRGSCPKYGSTLKGLDFRPEIFVEPFAGGGIASLTAVMDRHVDRAVLCERDPGHFQSLAVHARRRRGTGPARRGFRGNSKEREQGVRRCRDIRYGRRFSDPVAEQGQSGRHPGQRRFGDEGGRERAWDFLSVVRRHSRGTHPRHRQPRRAVRLLPGRWRESR